MSWPSSVHSLFVSSWGFWDIVLRAGVLLLFSIKKKEGCAGGSWVWGAVGFGVLPRF